MQIFADMISERNNNRKVNKTGRTQKAKFIVKLAKYLISIKKINIFLRGCQEGQGNKEQFYLEV